MSWTLASTTGPAPRIGAAMAYDAARRHMVLFGGNRNIGPTINNETWTFNGNTWTQVFPNTVPPARVWPAMAYDSMRGVVVMFGGLATGMPFTVLNDVWEWNGTDWVNCTPAPPAVSPPPRDAHAMAYDEATGLVMVFGGRGTPTPPFLSDTWAWSGASKSWLQLSATAFGSLGHMVYDCSRDRLVLVENGNGAGFVMTQEWDRNASVWVPQTPPSSPPWRTIMNITYDQARQRTVLFGGMLATIMRPVLDDTWEWDGTTWTQQLPAPLPPARRGHAMAYDEMRERVVVFGGQNATSAFNTTYEYQSLLPASFTSFGTGCGALTLGAQRLCIGNVPSNRDLPWIGDAFTVEMGSVPTTSIALLAAGLTRPPAPIPIPGFPGCTQLVNPITVLLRLPPQTTVGWDLGIPAVPAFAGIRLYLQGAALQPGALQVTPGGDARIGMR